MHSHDGTKRLFVKLLSLVLAGLALYFVFFYGIQTLGESASTATSTPTSVNSGIATSSTATSSPISTTTVRTAPTQSTPVSTTPPPSSGVVITNADNNSTVYLKKGQEFTVEYGSGLNWTIEFDPSSSITQERNIATSTGVQGVYAATEVGAVTLKATGAPICKPDQACPMFRALSTVTLIIQ